ncbi:zinc ribbon domain-containing protein [Streptomyces sp. NPDC086147]|uniref:NADase-type glycan-binding domain-containing protein n=1 Tax=Streptomyces sp. NPDC086147 TaxID=3155295 RepID=UPI00344E1339
MRACPSCGAANDRADDFCGNCGAYLGWSDEPAGPGTASGTPSSGGTPESTAAPADDTGGQARTRGRGSGGGEAGATGPDDTPAPDAPEADTPAPDAPASGTSTPDSPVPGTPVPGTSASGTPASGTSTPDSRAPGTPASGPPTPDTPAPDTTTGRARFTRIRAARTSNVPPTGTEDPVRPADPAPAPASASTPTSAPDPVPGPGTAARPPSAPTAPRTPAPRTPAAPAPVRDPILPVLPAKAVAPRPVVRPAAVDDEGSGLPCPVCGTPNRPERKFCRRCAAELRPTPKAAPLPWWRTVLPFRRRARAGSGRGVRFAVVLAVVLALCAAGFLLLPAGRALVEDVRDKLGKAAPVTPVRVEASGALPGHPATNTTDGLNNKYWAAPGAGASVTYTFRKPFRLVALIITNGASTSPEAYARQARALQVDLEVTTADGTRHVKELLLSDKPVPHTIQTGISDVRTVRLTLRSPVDLSGKRHLALAEVEFFQRSRSGSPAPG